MKTVYLLQGLPASGKTTWAKEVIDNNPGKYTRVNKDDLRSMMDNGKWSKSNEKLVLEVRDAIISEALWVGRHVIVDDTNLHEKHVHQVRTIARMLGAKFEIKFFDVDVNEAIERDLKRPNSVGSKVIKDMYKQFLQPEVEAPALNPILEDAIICDIDGTLAHGTGRSPFDYDRITEDEVDTTIRQILKEYTDKYPIILLSGRDSSCKEKTKEWLERESIPYNELYMRPAGDNRKDSIVKRELYEQNIKGRYNVAFVLDDRNQVVDMWRNELGLKCLQVAEGDF